MDSSASIGWFCLRRTLVDIDLTSPLPDFQISNQCESVLRRFQVIIAHKCTGDESFGELKEVIE